MDAMKLLSSLLRGKSLTSALGGELLGGLMGGGKSPSGSGGLGGMLGGLLGGSSGSRGGSGVLGGLLGTVMGGGAAAGGLGGLLGSVMGGGDAAAPREQASQQSSDQNEQAIVMIRAMVNAAKSDGRVDREEQDKIISNLGDDVSQAEIDFLKSEFGSPLDVAGFVSSVPKGMEQDVYVMSLTSIELDTQNEAKYLGQLAQSLKLDPAWCNQVHEQVGAPTIFG